MTMDNVPDFQEAFTKLFFKIELSAKEMHFYLEPESELHIYLRTFKKGFTYIFAYIFIIMRAFYV